MKDFLEKLSSYNLFNYLFPGVIFSFLADRFTAYPFVQSDLLIAFFVYYFTGLVISRLGSLILEPLLRKTGFVEFAPYEDFVRCSRDDDKLDVLSEANNMYRILTTVFISLGILKVAELTFEYFNVRGWVPPVSLWVFLLILFLFAYRKQTEYITRRINST